MNSEKTPLAPISEDRRVTFAARYMQDEETSCYAPVDVVRVKFIPHVSEYASSDRRNIWYTNDEIKNMKKRAFRDVDARKEEMDSNKKRPYHQQKQYTCDIRGLERLVYNDSNVCAQIRYESLLAVLHEQHCQRCWMYSANNTGGEYLDDERIRQVVMAKGRTIRSEEIALRLARQDEEDSDLFLERQQQHVLLDHKDNGDDADAAVPVAPASSSNRACGEQQRYQQYQETMLSPMMGRKNRNSGPKSCSKDCCWCVDVVAAVGRSLLLHAMLRPFLEIRRGDVFLD